MTTNAKAIIKKLEKSKADRKKVSLYLSESTYEQFQKICKKHKVSASEVMDELMQQFIDSAKGA